AILFNGGVFQPQALRDRLLEVMWNWYGGDWQPLVLTNPSLDLAVALGAAYFGWLRHTGGKRIGGGLPRSYSTATPAAPPPPPSPPPQPRAQAPPHPQPRAQATPHPQPRAQVRGRATGQSCAWSRSIWRRGGRSPWRSPSWNWHWGSRWPSRCTPRLSAATT